MLDKFIQLNEVCFNVEYPIALGWLIIVELLFLIIIWGKNR